MIEKKTEAMSSSTGRALAEPLAHRDPMGAGLGGRSHFSKRPSAALEVRWGNRTWLVCPWSSLRAASLSLVMVCVAAVLFDHWILARLEQRGLVASEGWKRHNRVVIANHERADRHLAVPVPPGSISVGVRAWQGFPVSKEKAKEHRILVMGDSFVWDSPYQTLNHMWWRQLQIELIRRGYHDVEVIAAGRSGMSTHDELDLARQIVPEFHPDLILWGFVTNDPDEGLVKQINTSQLANPIPGRIQGILKQVTPRLLDLFTARRNEKLATSYLGPKYGYAYEDWLHRIHEGENFERYAQTVQGVANFLDEMKTPGLMVTLPEAPIPDRFAFSYDKVIPVWRDAGVLVQDNLPAFVAAHPDAESTGPKSLLWGINPADGHPGPRSTAFLARQTADRLERDYPQVLGAKTSQALPLRINDWLPYDLDVRVIETDDRASSFELTYPATDEMLPTMPLETPTILLALEQPQPVQQIRLNGTGLKSARAWISTYDPLEHYDTQNLLDMGLQQGDSLTWAVPADISRQELSVILIHADVSLADRRLQLKLVKTDSDASLRGESQ